MKTTTAFRTISISQDHVWAGSGKLIDGVISDCGAQFCDDNDRSLEIYDLIEAAISHGKDSMTVGIDGESHRLTWSIVEPS